MSTTANPQTIDELMQRHGVTRYGLRNGIVVLIVNGRPRRFVWQPEFPAGFVTADEPAKAKPSLLAPLLEAFERVNGLRASARPGREEGEWLVDIDQFRTGVSIFERDFADLIRRIESLGAAPAASSHA